MGIAFVLKRGTSGLPGGGRSAIWSQSGELVARLEAAGAGIVIATETDAGWRGKAIALGVGR
jgi:hypothetical protein